jgi:hypothetical protein
MKIYTKFSHTFLFLAFFAFVFAGTFSACTEEDGLSIYAINEGRFDLNENEYVTMKIVSEEGTNNSSAFLRIENHTERLLGYGTYFTLQYYNKNNWEPDLLHGSVWEEIKCGLLGGETEERVNISLFIKSYNNNKKGRYKITKQFDLTSDWFSGSGDMICGIILSAEFEVK